MKQLLYLLCMALLAGCSKPKARLPEPTHVGANQFGCRVNGSIITVLGGISKNGFFNFGGTSFDYYPPYTTGTIKGVTDPESYVFHLDFPFAKTTGTYLLTDQPGNGIVSYNNGNNNYSIYATDDTHTGMITITYYDDTVIAGTFAMDAVAANGAVLHITEGRFDIMID